MLSALSSLRPPLIFLSGFLLPGTEMLPTLLVLVLVLVLSCFQRWDFQGLETIETSVQCLILPMRNQESKSKELTHLQQLYSQLPTFGNRQDDLQGGG